MKTASGYLNRTPRSPQEVVEQFYAEEAKATAAMEIAARQGNMATANYYLEVAMRYWTDAFKIERALFRRNMPQGHPHAAR